jgi:hypothetical protein
MKTKALWFACMLTLFWCHSLKGKDLQAELLPSSLIRPCSIVNAETLVEDFAPGGVTLLDRSGREFRFSYSADYNGPEVYFGQPNGKKVKSEAGSPEEACMLKILKEAYKRSFRHPFKKLPDDAPGQKSFWIQVSVRHFILVLEHRCKYKRDVEPA